MQVRPPPSPLPVINHGPVSATRDVDLDDDLDHLQIGTTTTA